MEKELNKIIKKLLKALDIKPTKIEVKPEEENSFELTLELDEQDTGLLIGYHGDTIASLQLILGLMLYKQSGEWTRVIVNIGDYRQKRQESLEQMADDTIKRVKFSGEPIALFNLNPFERRVVHLYLENNPDVLSESEGEGRNRHLIISPKDPSVNQPPPPSDDHAPNDPSA